MPASGHRHWVPRSFSVLAFSLAALLAVAALASPAWAAKRKDYSASISPTTAFGGLSPSLTLTITNLASSLQNLGSANITIPAGVTFVSFGVQTPPPGKTWNSPTLAGNVIQLRNPGPADTNALAPGESISLVVTVTLPCAPNSSYTWSTRTKQSNDFSGTGNGFNRVGPDPVLTVNIGCPDHLAFGQQPTDTIAGQHINAGLLPSGVTVLVQDSANQLVPYSTASISMAIGSGTGTLFGTTPVSAVGGVATFSDLAIDTAGTFTLAASSAPLTGASSASFQISGVAGKCDQSPCGAATGLHATQTDVTVGTVSVPVGPCSDTCFVSLDEGVGDFCDGTCTGNTIVFVPPSNQDGTGTLTLEVYKTLFSGNLADVRLFKQAEDGTVTELFDCPPVDPSSGAPCVSDRGHVPGGNALFTILLNAADPIIGGR